MPHIYRVESKDLTIASFSRKHLMSQPLRYASDPIFSEVGWISKFIRASAPQIALNSTNC